MVAEWGSYIKGETLADRIEFEASADAVIKSVSVGEASAKIWIVSLV
jgi:hypothetical protein